LPPGGPNPYDAAQTFSESDLSLSLDGLLLKNGSLSLPSGEEVIDDWEDGDLTPSGSEWSGWTGDTGALSAQSGTVLEGSVSGELRFGSSFGDVTATRSSETTASIGYLFRLDADTGNSTDNNRGEIRFFDGSGTKIGGLGFFDADNVKWAGSEVMPNWSPSTTYKILLDFDFSADSVTITIDGDKKGTFGFENSASGWAEIEYSNNCFDGGSRSVYFDQQDPYNGSATLEWPYPTDIYEWDVATFTQSPDGETVDVYVAYSTDGGSTWTRTNNGNPISRDYSLAGDSNISPSDEVRIEIEVSRADPANNPTIDSAYRSWRL
jgi:hypothetical protein